MNNKNELYIIPSYMPLRNYQMEGEKHVLDFGAEVHFKRLKMDDLHLSIFRCFLSPNTIINVANLINKNIEDVSLFCSRLVNEGLLIQYQDIPKSCERYDRHLNYFVTIHIPLLDSL